MGNGKKKIKRQNCVFKKYWQEASIQQLGWFQSGHRIRKIHSECAFLMPASKPKLAPNYSYLLNFFEEQYHSGTLEIMINLFTGSQSQRPALALRNLPLLATIQIYILMLVPSSESTRDRFKYLTHRRALPSARKVTNYFTDLERSHSDRDVVMYYQWNKHRLAVMVNCCRACGRGKKSRKRATWEP